ncbi:MAG: antibiotic biosynthesis monooxygenase [Chloroflexota bacterium]
MKGLVVTFHLLPGHESAFDALLADELAGIQKLEPGTLLYARALHAEAPADRVLLEVYRDEAAFAAHEEQPHTRRFLEERGQHLAGPVEVRWLVVSDVAGAWTA